MDDVFEFNRTVCYGNVQVIFQTVVKILRLSNFLTNLLLFLPGRSEIAPAISKATAVSFVCNCKH